MSERLLSSQRIRKRRVFEAIFKRGKRVSGTLFNLWIYEGPETQEEPNRPQIAIMVSRKVSLLANKRNLWKRRIREVFRRHQNEWKPGAAFLVQAKPHKTVPLYNEIKDEFYRLVKKAGGVK